MMSSGGVDDTTPTRDITFSTRSAATSMVRAPIGAELRRTVIIFRTTETRHYIGEDVAADDLASAGLMVKLKGKT